LALTLLAGCATTREAASPLRTEEAVLATEQAWYSALAQKDVAALERLLAEEFVLSGSAPELESRAQYLQTAGMPERMLEPLLLEDRRVRLHGPAAVTTGRAQLRGTWKGRPLALTFRYTNVFVERRGRWQAVASHVSSIGP
jgi:ketosteroid isomerase-like protein